MVGSHSSRRASSIADDLIVFVGIPLPVKVRSQPLIRPLRVSERQLIQLALPNSPYRLILMLGIVDTPAHLNLHGVHIVCHLL